MNGRIKVQRMDRNGKIVSRWVNPEDSKRKPMSALPQPASPDNPTKVELVRGVRSILENTSLVRRQNIDYSLSKNVSIEDLKILHQLLTDESRDTFGLSVRIIQALEHPEQGNAFIPRIIRHFDDYHRISVFSDAANILLGLDDYEEGFSIEQETALLKVSIAATRVESGIMLNKTSMPMQGLLLKDRELMELVAERPDRADDIVSIIDDHKEARGWKVRQILDGGLHGSVASGAL